MAKRTKKKKEAAEVVQVVETQASGTSPLDFVARHWKPLLQVLVIVVAGLWIYGPVLHGDWLWDDAMYITANPLLHDPARLWKIWFKPGSVINYFPITATAQWMQWEFWGNNTLGYHVTNVLLHLCSSLLVWKFLSKFGLRLAWLGGLIFAIHPVQVESVAWISELKNTLSLPPLLLAMCAWIDYEEYKRKRDYFLTLGFFLTAMLCKTTMVMFPAVILLYAWWKRGRVGWSDLKASAPFFVISLVLGVITVLAERWYSHNPSGNDLAPLGGFLSRLACAGLVFSFYFSKCILPIGLLPIYPQWSVNPPSLMQFLPWPILGGVMGWLWSKRHDWGRHVLLGMGFFLINLMPFAGFLSSGFMDITWVMDHFLYIPIIGLIGLVVAGLGQLYDRFSNLVRLCTSGVIAAVMVLLAWESCWYAEMFINQEMFWTYTLERNPEAWPAHYSLGIVLFQTGRMTEAINQYEQALKIKPDYAEAHDNLGIALERMGQVAEAMEHYEQALRIKPDDAKAHNNLGGILAQTKRISEAIDQYEQALKIEPDDAEAHYNLANALAQTGRMAEAIDQFEAALKIKPEYAEAHNNLANALIQTGRAAEAMEHCEQALKIQPDYADAHNNLGNALAQTGRMTEAIDQYEQAMRIKPDDVEAHYNLGNALLQIGRMTEAIDQYEQALRIKPDFAEAHCNLGNALFQTGRTAEAIDQYEQALKIKPNFVLARNNLARLQDLQKIAPVKK